MKNSIALALLLACGTLMGQSKPASPKGTGPTVWPTIGRVWVTLDSVEANYPGNERAKPCGPDGAPVGKDDMVCVDVNARHIVASFYQKKENCERWEQAVCTQFDGYWFPVGKVIFVDETPPAAPPEPVKPQSGGTIAPDIEPVKPKTCPDGFDEVLECHTQTLPCKLHPDCKED